MLIKLLQFFIIIDRSVFNTNSPQSLYHQLSSHKESIELSSHKESIELSSHKESKELSSHIKSKDMSSDPIRSANEHQNITMSTDNTFYQPDL